MKSISEITDIYKILELEQPRSILPSTEMASIFNALPFKMPISLYMFYINVNGWGGFLKDQYFVFFSIQEALDRTLELDSQNFDERLIAIGNNGASEVFFVGADNHIYVGDEIGLPESLIKVADSFVELLKYPEKIDDAFG